MATIAPADSIAARSATASRSAPPTVDPVASRVDAVRVFGADPDLLAGLDATTAELLRWRVVAPKLWIEPGRWEPPPALRNGLGLLVIDGLITRTIELQGRRCPELVGAGDLLRPWDDLDVSLAHTTSWTALERSAVAVLDARFCTIVSRWPSITAQLLARSIQRSHSLSVQLAIVHVRHADLRVHMLLWHLADRWGRVTRDGVHLPVRLTHEMLAELTCMRRPTASSALTNLARRGNVIRRDDGTLLLTGPPPRDGRNARAEA